MNAHRGMRFLRRGACVVALCGALTSRGTLARDVISDHLAGPPVLLHGTGGAETLRVVILGDGFTADDESLGAYRTAAVQLTTQLVNTVPFSTMATAMSIFRLDVTSDEAGIDVPRTPCDFSLPASLARSPKDPNNILATHWCGVDVLSNAAKPRFLGSDSELLPQFANAGGFVPDVAIVIVNDWMFGATTYPDDPLLPNDNAAMTNVVFVSLSQDLLGEHDPNIPESFPGVAIHEFGHTRPFLLLDEYLQGRPAGERPAQLPIIDASPNLSSTLMPLKWENLVDPAVGRPTDCTASITPDIGGVEGGYGFNAQVFHARCQCTMKTWSDSPFCPICRRAIIKGLAPYLPLLMYTPPRKLPTGKPGPDPSPMWVLLDSLAIKSGTAGWYSLDYTISVPGTTPTGRPPVLSGVWPHGQGKYLEPGQTVAVDDLLTMVPRSWLKPGATLTASYRLYRRANASDSAASATLVARVDSQVPVDGLQTGLQVINQPTHVLTLGLILPR